MIQLLHLPCRNTLYINLTNYYKTVGKILVDSTGRLYVGDGTLLPTQNRNKNVLDSEFFCPNCGSTINIMKDSEYIGGSCYGCGNTLPIKQLQTFNGYFLCQICAKKHGKTGKPVDLTSIKMLNI